MIEENKIMGRLDVKWDSYWNGFMSNPFIETVRFFLISRACDRLLKMFIIPNHKSKICELGCGTAVVARYLGNKFKADLTLVDNNPTAQEMIKETFKDYPYQYNIRNTDVFNLSDLNETQDLVVSGGLIEHFIDDARKLIIKAHCDMTTENGYILILVPCPNWWYSILNGFIFKHLHLLDDILEVPWTYQELENTLDEFGYEILSKTYVISELGVLAKRKTNR